MIPSAPAVSTSSSRLTVTVGICAYNEERRIGACLEAVLSQQVSPEVDIVQVIVVASGCTDGTEAIVEGFARRDSKIVLVRERTRSGKASALNQILARSVGDVIVLSNADARMEERALDTLLTPFMVGSDVAIACGGPVLNGGATGLAGEASSLFWRLHNRTLQALSDAALPNHCCDELLAMRRGFVERLPADTINDGAYLSAIAALRGVRVKFIPESRIEVEVPSSIGGLVSQRRRILRGHQQVRKTFGRSVNTLEGLMRTRPRMVIRILREEFGRHPDSLVLFLLLLLPLEGFALGGAMIDGVRFPTYDPAWPMVD
jgi:poly-beta-1,6-N-acetyl-D-glucosamine synthase